MSTTLRDVIEGGGFDIRDLSDAQWLVSVQSEFEDLLEEAEQVIEEAQEGVDEDEE